MCVFGCVTQVTVDVSVPPSPVCHSVEMDVYLGQSDLSGPSFLSLPDSSGPEQDSPSSVRTNTQRHSHISHDIRWHPVCHPDFLQLLGSKAFDSGILEFWAASGLAPQRDGAGREGGMVGWPSCDSLLDLPAAPNPGKKSSALGPTRLLRRKRALMQLRLASPSSPDSPSTLLPSPSHSPMPPHPVQTHNLTTALTLSGEKSKLKHSVSG